MKELNLEVAGEFLLMASTLLQIKSQLLLPAADIEDAEADEQDPRAELIQRLLEYQKFKEAAGILDGFEQKGRDVFSCRLPAPDGDDDEKKEEILELELFDLIEAFRSILSRVPTEIVHEIKADSISIADRINTILSLLQERKRLAFDEIFFGVRTREEVIANFLAVLELCKNKMIRIFQGEMFGKIWLSAAVDDDETGSINEDYGTHG